MNYRDDYKYNPKQYEEEYEAWLDSQEQDEEEIAIMHWHMHEELEGGKATPKPICRGTKSEST
jgi:hypothetical protein